MRKYGVSVVTFWPYTLRGVPAVIEMAIKAGYDGVQLLPMRGFDYSQLKAWKHKVLSYEDAWNHGPFWRAILRLSGFVADPNPTLLGYRNILGAYTLKNRW